MGKPLQMLPAALAMMLAGAGCQMKMPKVRMPEMLREEKPEARLQRHVAAAVADDDDVRLLRAAADALDTARAAGWDRHRLLVEMLACRARITGDEQAVRFARLLETMRFPRSTVVEVAAARLDNADASVAAAARALLRYAAPPDPRGRVDFTHFGRYLDAHLSSPPARLVVWMYETDASAAMWQMMTVFGAQTGNEQRRAVLLAERTVAEAVWRKHNGAADEQTTRAAADELRRLAGMEQWWVRAWAAYMLARHPELRTEGVMDKLRRDDSPVVKTLAQ